jgi:threonine dehydratase
VTWLDATHESLLQARAVVRQYLKPSRLESRDIDGKNLILLREDAEDLGTYKVRAAAHALHFAPSDRSVAAASTGNFAIGLATLAARTGRQCTIFTPERCPPWKLASLAALGATVITNGRSLDEARACAAEHAVMTDALLVDQLDRASILGLSSMGLDLLEAFPDLGAIVVPLGLGATAAGFVLARNAIAHRATIVGVVPESCGAWSVSWRAGTPQRSEPGCSLADALRTAQPPEAIFSFLRRNMAAVVTVSEESITESASRFAKDYGVCLEGASALALAALDLPSVRSLAGGGRAGVVTCRQGPARATDFRAALPSSETRSLDPLTLAP